MYRPSAFAGLESSATSSMVAPVASAIEEARLLHGLRRMTLTLTGLLVLLLIAGVCGAIGRAVAGGMRGGFLVSIAVGFVGALLGTFLAHTFRLPELLVVTVDRHPFPLLWSIIGSAVFVALGHLISARPMRRHPRYD